MYLIEPIRNGKYIADGAVALAVQVYILNNLDFDDTVILPYYCEPIVQLGLFQNAEIETNSTYMKENNISLVRRDTGGGTIYIDKGSVNICFIIPKNSEDYGNFKKFYDPAIKILHSLGATEVVQSGRNDLAINGKKVSGAAMTLTNDKIYGGYSLLLDIDFDNMVKTLNPNRKKINSKGISSVRSRVTGLREFFSEQYKNITTEQLKDYVLCHLLNIDSLENANRYELTEHDWQEIDKLIEKKYKNWDWNYGNSPRYSYNRDEYFTGVGTVNITLEITTGFIKSCRIYGDFFAKKDIKDIENALINTRIIKEDLLNCLENYDLTQYFGPLTSEQLVALILS